MTAFYDELLKVLSPLMQYGGIALFIASMSYFVVRFLFSSYLMEKGKNIATKEDIQLITDKIESTKLIYTQKSEEFKAIIFQSFDLQRKYNDKRTELLLDFYNHVADFYYDIIPVNFGDYPSNSEIDKNLFLYQEKFRTCVANILKSHQHLYVYFSKGEPILESSQWVVAMVMECQSIHKNLFSNVKMNLINEVKAFVSGKLIEGSVNATNSSTQKYNEQMKPKIVGLSLAYTKFIEQMNESIKPQKPQS